jgi:hypothetical protein
MSSLAIIHPILGLYVGETKIIHLEGIIEWCLRIFSLLGSSRLSGSPSV